MESYDKLKSLPDAEKAKCFEILLESIKLSSNNSDDPEKSPSKNNLSSIFNNLKSVSNVSLEESSRKKQKTLDSWLIKPKDSSPLKKKSGESSCTLDRWLVKPKELSPHKGKTGESSCNLEESVNHRPRSDKSESLDSAQSSPSKLDDCNFLSSCKNTKSSPQNKKRPLSKSDAVINSSVECIQTSTKICETAVTDAKIYSLRLKRKCTEPSINSSPVRSSIQSDNTDLTKSKKEIIQSKVINKFDVNPSQTIHTDLFCCPKVDNFSNENIKNQRSKKSNSNLQICVQSSTKNYKVTELEDFSISDKTRSKESELQEAIHSTSLLSNREAFHILEVACSRMNLNVLDILENKNVQKVLSDPKKLDNETILLINSFKSKDKFSPVVHLIESKKKLDQILKKVEKPV